MLGIFGAKLTEKYRLLILATYRGPCIHQVRDATQKKITQIQKRLNWGSPYETKSPFNRLVTMPD